MESAFKQSCSDENRAAHTVSSISGLPFLHIQCLLLIKNLGSFRWERKAGGICEVQTPPPDSLGIVGDPLNSGASESDPPGRL